MAEEKEIKEVKKKKLADPMAATIDPASQQMKWPLPEHPDLVP